MKKLLGIVVISLLLSGSVYAFEAESYKKLNITKAKLMIMQVEEPLKKARKIKPKDAQTVDWALKNYCSVLNGLTKNWPEPLPDGTDKKILKAVKYIKDKMNKENC